MPTRKSALAIVALSTFAVATLAGCGEKPAAGAASTWSRPPSQQPPSPQDSAGAAASPAATSESPAATVTAESCASNGWDCAQSSRFGATAAYVRSRPGQMGVILHDRVTGSQWRAGATSTPMWTASTIKVAIATTLLERQRAGEITLTAGDRTAMAQMLNVSSNDATDTLWQRYDGPAMLSRFRSRYGMSGLSVVAGMTAYWRNLRCTADDLDHLMSYALGSSLNPDDRAYLISALRGVATIQHWGVWAAGPGLDPGNKDGWAVKPDPGGSHWVTHTVGFAGPGERYVVVVMYSQPPGGTIGAGVTAVSKAVTSLFGSPLPALATPPV